MSQKYNNLYQDGFSAKNEIWPCAAPIVGLIEKYIKNDKWHTLCNIKGKSDTLISFLLKKVCFVPQSRPFSIGACCFAPPPFEETVNAA